MEYFSLRRSVFAYSNQTILVTSLFICLHILVNDVYLFVFAKVKDAFELPHNGHLYFYCFSKSTHIFYLQLVQRCCAQHQAKHGVTGATGSGHHTMNTVHHITISVHHTTISVHHTAEVGHRTTIGTTTPTNRQNGAALGLAVGQGQALMNQAAGTSLVMIIMEGASINLFL